VLNKNLAALGIPFLFLICVAFGGLFVVTEMQQVLVLQFGQLVRTIRSPGLYTKIPFIQDLMYYDKRILDFDVSATEVTLGDQKRIVVDTFTRYRIVDPALFYKTVSTELGAQTRLAAQITGSLRGVLGSTPLSTILSPERAQKLSLIRGLVNKGCQELGIEVVDVRIRRADLPAENSQAIFNRMISERQKEAQETRAEGMERAEIIRALADLECTTLRANARKAAQEEMGLADKKALEIVGQAYGQNQEFAAFYQSLAAYPKALKNSRYVLTLEGDFFNYLRKRDPENIGRDPSFKTERRSSSAATAG